MKSFYSVVSIFLLSLMATGCTSTTPLQSSESDDLYYSSTDRTTIQQAGSGNFNGAVSDYTGNTSGSNSGSGEVVNPDYSGTTGTSGTNSYSSGSGQTNVSNNYNYYDGGYGYSYRAPAYRTYSSYGYAPYYSPFGYSAPYCYGIYDPFCYPGYYPYSGLSFSIGIGYGFGYPAYGYGAFGYAPVYAPYGYYGGYYPYRSVYHDGYYPGNGLHRNVNYGPRHDRGGSPVNVPGGYNGGGRPPMPGRVGYPNQTGNPAIPAGRPQRIMEGQPAGTVPNTTPNRIETQPATNTPGMGGRPQREQVQPGNYQFQQNQQPNQQYINQPGLQNRPAGGRNGAMPVYQNNTPAQPSPQMQQERPVRQESVPYYQGRPAQQPNVPVQQQQAPQQNYSRPQRENFQMHGNPGGGFNQQPSFQHSAPSGGGMHQGGGFGRPGR